MPESPPQFDLYAELNVAPGAPAEVIVAAHRALVRRAHPDVDGTRGAQERTKRLNVARDWLTDTDRRAQYDRAHPNRSRWDTRDQGPGSPHELRPSLDRGWERSSGRAELELFIERCGRLTARDIRLITSEYARAADTAGRLETAAQRLIELSRSVSRGTIVAAAADAAVAHAQGGKRPLGSALQTIIEWNAFAIGAEDVAPADALLVLTPWRRAVGDDCPRSTVASRWLKRLFPVTIATLATALLMVGAKLAPTAALSIVVVVGLLAMKLNRPPPGTDAAARNARSLRRIHRWRP